MKRVLRQVCYLMCLLPLTLASYSGQQAVDLLIPQPKHIKVVGRPILLSDGGSASTVIVLGRSASDVERVAADVLRKELQNLGTTVEVVRESEIRNSVSHLGTRIVLGTPDSSESVKANLAEFAGLAELGREGYLVRPLKWHGQDSVFCAGNTAEGAKHCAMTLLQLAEKKDGRVMLPLVKIDDSPDISWRGVNKMIDYIFPDKIPHKGYVEGITNYKELIDNMMRVKFNTLVIHVACDAWRIRGPEGWKDQIQGIIDYAHARGIRVALLLYHTLSGRGRIKVPGKDPCGTDPDNFNLNMDEFRSYIRKWPDLDAYLIHISEYSRCTCEVCERTPREEEFLRYLEGFNAILRQHSRDAILAYCAFPESNYNWLSKEHKNSLPPGVRNLIWADWFIREALGGTDYARIPSQLGFLAPLSEAVEAQQGWFDDLPGRTWYWIYANGNLDLRFPVPEFFKSRSLASRIKQVESIQGEFGYQRGADLNTLALSAFAWNSVDDVTRFRQAAITSLYGEGNLGSMLPVEVAYEKLVQDFVGMLWTIGDGWRSPAYEYVDDLLARVVSETSELSRRIATFRGDSALVAERLRGYQDDLDILKSEALVRQKFREAYLTYEVYSPQVYGVQNPETTERVTRVLKLVDEAIEANRQLCNMREARATPLAAAKRHQEALEKLRPLVESALRDVQLNRRPARVAWEKVSAHFWSPYYDF